MGVGQIVGLVLGISATVKAKRYPTEYGGRNLAIIGIVLNGVALLLVVAGIVLVSVPNMMESLMATNEASAISTLRTIGSAEATYQSTIASGKSFGTLDQLVQAGLLGKDVATKNGYRFEVTPSETRTGWSSQYRFEAFATPVSYDRTGRRSYYTSQDFIIRGADKKGGQASASDPPLQ
jgi:hypothetical protein